jgi:hypothetical protein
VLYFAPRMPSSLRSSCSKLGLSFAAFAATLALAGPAFADRVAVLGFPPEDAKASSATEAAVTSKNHTLPAASELAAGKAAVTDGAPDTSDEYRAFGNAAKVDWTVRGTVTRRPSGYRLELEVCQIASGRVEILAREVDESAEVRDIGEMLALLLRPEGIANAELPWQNKKPASPKPAEPPPEPKKPVVVTPPEPPAPPAVRHPYAENAPFSIGLATGLLSAVSRPSNATGSATSFVIGGTLGYHLEAVPGLELRANVEGAAAGPKALFFDVGARYAIPLAPTIRLFLVPDAGLGSFVTMGAQKSARFWVRLGAYASLGLGEHVALELGPDFGVTPGGAGTVVLFGGALRAVARF